MCSKPFLKGRESAFFPVHSDSVGPPLGHGGLTLRVYDHAAMVQHALVQL